MNGFDLSAVAHSYASWRARRSGPTRYATISFGPALASHFVRLSVTTAYTESSDPTKCGAGRRPCCGRRADDALAAVYARFIVASGAWTVMPAFSSGAQIPRNTQSARWELRVLVRRSNERRDSIARRAISDTAASPGARPRPASS